MDSLLEEHSIEHEKSPPHSQHKNGVAERMMQTIVTKARCMLIDSNLPAQFWGEAVVTAVYLHRRSPSSTLNGCTPFSSLYNQDPAVQHLRRFGCTVNDTRPDSYGAAFAKAGGGVWATQIAAEAVSIWFFTVRLPHASTAARSR